MVTFYRKAGFLGVAAASALLLLAETPASTAKENNAAPSRAEIDFAINKFKPALVRIRVVSTEYGDGREIKEQAVGSGAIITKDGYLITNHHVAGHATRMFCTLWNREEMEAELIGTDPMTDISILKLKPEKPREFESVTFGVSSKLHVGDPVLAMGCPMALSQSVTLGIISNTEMIMPRWGARGNQFRLDGEDVGSLVKWIAHDAAIYGGNSGGPLVNLKGEIVGINEISYGLSGAIPANVARSVAEHLMKEGRIRRAYLGIDVQALFKHGQSKEQHGLIISGVMGDSPADKAGIKAGDLLLRLAGKAVDVHFDEQLPDFMWMMTGLPIGRETPVVVKRDGRELTLKVVPIERTELFPKQTEIKEWGFTARNLSPLLAREMKRASQDGVLVSTVRPGGPAGEAKPTIEPRDVLVEVAGTPVKDLKALEELTKKLIEGRKDPVPVVAVYERKAARFMTVVKVGMKDDKDPSLEVTKAWLPVETHVISREIAKQLGEPDLRGFYITRVYPDSTADKAGLKPGDFILAVDGEKLTATGAEHEDELSNMIHQYDVGKTVELSVQRNKENLKTAVELARSPHQQREMKKYTNPEFEFTARDVSFFDSADEQWDKEQHGALVEEVKPGSWAELGSLSNGDLILEVDGNPVNNVESLHKIMDQLVSSRKSTILIKVLRGIHTSYLQLEPNWKS